MQGMWMQVEAIPSASDNILSFRSYFLSKGGTLFEISGTTNTLTSLHSLLQKTDNLVCETF